MRDLDMTLKSSIKNLYPGFDQSRQLVRYSEAIETFEKDFNTTLNGNSAIFSVPGRTEIGGNHTDHNHGKVLAGAVNLDAIAVVAKRNDGLVILTDSNPKFRGDRVDFNQKGAFIADERHYKQSYAMIMGVFAKLKELGYEIGGFNAHVDNEVFAGSGMSSSAAYEVLIGTIVNHLYNDGKIDSVVIAQVAQYAENVYFGKPCGLMDQTACSVGGIIGIDFKDPSAPRIEKIGFDFASTDHSLCITDVREDHTDLTDDYASIKNEMMSVAKLFGKEYLADLDPSVVWYNGKLIRETLGERPFIRAVHFHDDCERVSNQITALNSNDFEEFKRLITESGNSSFKYLQNIYSNSTPNKQAAAMALCMSEILLGDYGAYRIHGGGFGGTIQAFVPNRLLDYYKGNMDQAFGKDACKVLTIRPVGATRVV